MVADFIQVVIYLLGGGFCLFMLYGFWRGLSIKPNRHIPHPSAESQTPPPEAGD